MSTLVLHCLSNYFIWVLGIIWANWLSSNNVEMSFFVCADGLRMSTIFQPYRNVSWIPWLNQLKAEHIKCLPKGHQNLTPGESRTSGPSDSRLLLVLSAICSQDYSKYEKSLGKYIPPPDSAKTQRVVYLSFNPQTSPQLHLQAKLQIKPKPSK